MIPTVGFNMRKITKGNVTIKVWDIGGQPRFRSMWERYCRGVNAIVYVCDTEFAVEFVWSTHCFSYMVDAADLEKIEASRNELHNLLDKPQLAGIPVLVLGNKRDLPHALDENGLIERMYVNQYIWVICVWHTVVFLFVFLKESLCNSRPRDLLLLNIVQGEGQHWYHAAVADCTFEVRHALEISASRVQVAALSFIFLRWFLIISAVLLLDGK